MIEKGSALLTENKNYRILLKYLFLAMWAILVLYPNPGRLAASVYRLKNPPVQPLAVSGIARELENSSPGEIRDFVYRTIPYSFDWEVYNMPWYFPTLEEALQNESGDCKARYLLFASLMEELDIPYYKNISLTHIWVGYEGMPENALERREEILIKVDQNGKTSLNMPRPDMKRSYNSFYSGFWEVMPGGKKLLIYAGFPVFFIPFYALRLHMDSASLKPAGKK
jgi:hypothetical protein